MPEKNIHTFIGCDADYEESPLVLFGAPLDSTTSYRAGTRFASSAMRNESFGIETYSLYQDKDLLETKIFDGGDLELPFGSPQKALAMIESYTEEILTDGKVPLMIGGEHLVTLGALRAALQKYPDLVLIHFDAHADLREEYLGESLSHGSVIRRCHELLGDGRIFQFGIRSGDREEFSWAKDHVFMEKFTLHQVGRVADMLGGKPVYLTVDLDVLDPAGFPGTGTPEAGGVSFTELREAIAKLRGLKIIGGDICELCPPYDQSGVSTALACKFLREVLLQIYPWPAE